MRIKELHIKNFQVIEDAHFLEMGNTVVIAGPNGVGKTTVKTAIIQTFQNGSPPTNCKIILQPTNTEEKNSLKNAEEISLPDDGFFSYLRRDRKKISAKTRLIHINSDRQIQNVNFQQYGIAQLGEPETENIGFSHYLGNVNDRFQDVIDTLYRMKTKLVTQYGTQAAEEFSKENSQPEKVEIAKLQDPTEKFVNIFNDLLYPKKMVPINPSSHSIQFYDEKGNIRNFHQLSSGEKEVIAITFDIQMQNPEDSIILIDEPELHLHPELSYRLLRSLHSIGKNNQFILFTHSADVIGSSFDTGVWFLRPVSKAKGENQIKRIDKNTLADITDIPNLRETIGMLSLGKRLLFVEGTEVSIDRIVFSTLALSKKKDVAIIPSSNCRMIENLSHFSEILSRGLLGLELRMIRDRDGLTDKKVAELIKKSGGRLTILPFYHIENAFLVPSALHSIAQTLAPHKNFSLQQIEGELLKRAKAQIKFCAANYTKQEVYLSTPSMDISPKVESDTGENEIVQSMLERKNTLIKNLGAQFSDEYIQESVRDWTQRLAASIEHGWTEEARKNFYGKRLLAEMNNFILGGSQIRLWEQILRSESPECRKISSDLEVILTQSLN